ncbi:MAG: hypothetical protein FJ399_01025 [Verrucomicrobia bacterium]|nr:hypothetical protein [Verrucomicrobiota bacterium]
MSNAEWFAAHVLPHEAALRAWLAARFPSVPDHDDITQEAFTRVLRQRERGEVQSAKALLFTAARNLALDRLRRRRASPEVAITDFGESCVLESTPDAAAAIAFFAWPRATAPDASRLYSTSAGGFERAVLDDGSVVELNGSTRLRVDFVRGERRVALLAGEAHFTVVPDATRPFVISPPHALDGVFLPWGAKGVP